MSKPVRKTSIVGAGCLLQFIGLACVALGLLTVFTIFLPALLIPLGVWTVFRGSRKSVWYECGRCCSVLPSKRSLICPSCGSGLGE